MPQLVASTNRRILVLANCTHHSIALALRSSGMFGTVQSAELYSMSKEERSRLSEKLDQFDAIVTIEHAEWAGPLATQMLRERLGDRLLILPTPFFSGLTPDMVYLNYQSEIARSTAVLGDYHSALVLADVQSGLSVDETTQRYASGTTFEQLDVKAVWQASLNELKVREASCDITLSDFIERATADGSISEQFLSFNHPAEGLISHIARQAIFRLTGQAVDGVLITPAQHNLYADAYWPMHAAVAEILGLPRPTKNRFKQPKRMGEAFLNIEDFARLSAEFFLKDRAPEGFSIVTPHYVQNNLKTIDTPSVRKVENSQRSSDRHQMKTSKVKRNMTTDPQQLIMTHLGRSGSTVLAQLLKSHSRITWLDEYFSLKWIRDKSTYNFTREQMSKMIAEEVAKIREGQPNEIVGHEIKLMNFLQNPSCNLIDYAKAYTDPAQYRHVVLRRRNVLKRICSVHKAAQTKTYHLSGDDMTYRTKTFKLDFKNLVDFDTGQRAATFPELIDKALEREDQYLRNFHSVGIRYLELWYEDDISEDPTQAYRKVLNFLGLDFQPASPRLSKTGGSLKNELSNYDILEDQMRGTRYEWMLD
ncbi:WcbI family polysaccharide biosynthesis putative acetyltransferase [Litorisediminicola beolgyonensis]